MKKGRPRIRSQDERLYIANISFWIRQVFRMAYTREVFEEEITRYDADYVTKTYVR